MSFWVRAFKPTVFVVCLAPLLGLVYLTLTNDLGVNPIEYLTLDTGETALKLLIASLAVTPIRRITGWNRIISVRRMLGVFAFFYALLHFLIYLVFDRFFDVAAIVDDVIKRKFILAGMVAFLAMLPLAITSTNGWIRRLGKKWQKLHRLAYVAGIAGAIHYVWKTKVPEPEPYMYALAVAVVLGARLVFMWNKKRAAVAVGLVALCVLPGCGAEPAPAVAPPPVASPAPAPLAQGDTWLAGESVGAEPVMFVALAGNWTVRDDAGEKVLRVDGTTWKTGTPPANLTEKSAALFPASAAAFESRVKAGLQFPYGIVRQVGTFGDGEIRVDFKLVGGASDQFASLLFGLTDDSNHYAYRYNTKDGDTALWRVVDGQRERLHHGGVPVAVKLGEWRTLRLKIAGTQLTGWVDDTEALTFTLPAPVTGRVGLWSKADSVTDYRRFVAR
jgi:sulfoxide reductase heme-binding subunit YedZ